MKRGILILSTMVLLAAPATAQVQPPDTVNYQGVLRTNTGEPLSGVYAMEFHFWNDPIAGHEIGSSDHGAVEVVGGVFDVVLGGGSWYDGPGPGTYNSLGEVFRDHAEVFIQLEVASELLEPRVPVQAAAYATSASYLDGYDSPFFLNVSAQTQGKEGDLFCVTPEANAHLAWPKVQGDDVLGIGIWAEGDYAGGVFQAMGGSGHAEVGLGHIGTDAHGNLAGGFFYDSDGSGSVWLGIGNRGLEAYGDGAAGYFENTAGSGLAYLGQTDMGIRAHGNGGGGYFEDLNSSGEAWLAENDYGIHAVGTTAGGWFQSGSAGNGVAWVGYGTYGIRATGSDAGGWFDSVKVDGRTTTGILEITGGSDVAEPFPVREGEEVPEGAVLIIDDTATGGLKLSRAPYDPRVAGVASGAGGIRPGITLSHDEPADDEVRVALTGRVYCLATAENGPIRPGDLLTTSSLPGHAMRATDRDLSQGSTLGKAMSSLEKGEDLVLVLVNLQ